MIVCETTILRNHTSLRDSIARFKKQMANIFFMTLVPSLLFGLLGALKERLETTAVDEIVEQDQILPDST